MEIGDYRNPRSISGDRNGLWKVKGGPGRLSDALSKVLSLSLVRSLTGIFEGGRSAAPGDTFPTFRVEPALPLNVSGAVLGVEPLTFGAGATFGEQVVNSPLPEGDVPLWGGGDSRGMLFWVDLPRGVVSPGSRIGLVADGSGAFLAMDLDWFISKSGKSVGFLADPSTFETLWIFDSMVDHGDVFENFGFVPGLSKSDPEESSRFAAASMRMATDGPTKASVESFVSAAAGQRLSPEAGEVGSISQDKRGNTIITVGESYAQVGPGIPLLSTIYEGAEIRSGQAVSSVTRVLDPVDNIGWWREFQNISIGLPFDGGCVLIFPNSPAGNWPPIPNGSQSAVREFLNMVDWGAAPSGIINPAEVSAEAILGPVAIPVVVNLSQVVDVPLFFRRMTTLRRFIPPSSVLVVSAFLPIDDGNQGLSATEGENRVSDIGIEVLSFSAGPSVETSISVAQRTVNNRRF